MRIYFSWRVTLVGVLLATGMLRLSWWQWERHNWKQGVIRELDSRLALPPAPLETLLEADSIRELPYRRAWVEGEFDYSREVVLQNRRHEQMAGVFLLTPLKLRGSGQYVLVNRGFIPLSQAAPDVRAQYRPSGPVRFVGLLKESAFRKFMSPRDGDTGPGKPWVDRWLRVDLGKISQQLPYPLLPLYAELMDEPDIQKVRERIVSSRSEKEELLSLASRDIARPPDLSKYTFPIPAYDIIVPPGRHLGYVFEWAFMALATVLMCLILQLRPPRNRNREGGEGRDADTGTGGRIVCNDQGPPVP
jgi:surfeit locus 1 family protein